MNQGGPKKDKLNKDLVNFSKKTTSLCKTDFESIGINIAAKYTIHHVGGHNNLVNSVCFSPDGKLLATGSKDTTARLWDVASGRCVHVLEGHTSWVKPVSFSPNGKLLVTLSPDHTARIWDVATGWCVHVLEGHTSFVVSVSFSPNGKLIATGSGDNTARIWDVTTGRCVHVLEGHTSGVYTARFSPNGKLLATGSNDKAARIWDMATGRCVHVLEGHAHTVNSVCFSLNGELLATGSWDHSVRFWDINSGTHLVTFYNLNRGFLLTTPPDEVAKSGWFWTDRPDLVHLVKCGENGEESEVVGDDDPERKAYIDAHNRQDMVMNRLHHFEKYQAEVDRLVNQNQLQRLEHGIERQRKALPDSEDPGDN